MLHDQHYLDAPESTKPRDKWVLVPLAPGIEESIPRSLVTPLETLPDGKTVLLELFTTPPRSREPVIGHGGNFVPADRALFVRLTPEKIGNVLFEKWEEHLPPEAAKKAGHIAMRTLACSDQTFWEIPALLHTHGITLGGSPLVRGLVGVTTSPSEKFENSHLSLCFSYSSTQEPLSIAAIGYAMDGILIHLRERGLREALIAEVSEGRGLEERRQDSSVPDMPLPKNFEHAVPFGHMLPEALQLNTLIHGRHKQLSFSNGTTDIRLPFDGEPNDALSHLLNESALARKLSKQYGFTASLVGSTPTPPSEKNAQGKTPEELPTPLRELLNRHSLADLSFSQPRSESDGYYGPYLHIHIEHGEDPGSKTEAKAAALTLIYRFHQTLLGLEHPSSEQ